MALPANVRKDTIFSPVVKGFRSLFLGEGSGLPGREWSFLRRIRRIYARFPRVRKEGPDNFRERNRDGVFDFTRFCREFLGERRFQWYFLFFFNHVQNSWFRPSFNGVPGRDLFSAVKGGHPSSAEYAASRILSRYFFCGFLFFS